MSNNKTIDGLQNLFVNGAISTNELVTIFPGPTSGSVSCSMPFQGPHYKYVLLWFNQYVNHTTTPMVYTYPVPFTFTPETNPTNIAGGLNTSTTTTSFTANPNSATTFTGAFYIFGI